MDWFTYLALCVLVVFWIIIVVVLVGVLGDMLFFKHVFCSQGIC